ncbi:uncharacterized protein F5147DRAFT_771729 [Suillus discolor]|uniref:Uncharacterized protein n=1 Tax=Suillus discolor TaxID=1912936 RepID=A0A9P7FBB9_9AGAM|nr:uncharacterized protein F5147DRAFT_771729 [Suillus discolor]KAG2111579.1 hypothetical protein F5147DRAFT_771729 [Suillus discolor]
MAGVATGRGRGSRGRPVKCGSHGLIADSSAPPSASPPASTGSAPALKMPTIHWEKKNSPCTACLIEWCKINQDARLKIFSDSAKDAKEEGHTRQQMTTQKNTYMQQLAASVFAGDEDPKTGAGLSFEELNENEKTRTLLDRLLQTFPWWVDLHGWWRTNPAYNTSFLTADPGQDFSAEAMDVFGKGKGKEKETLDDADREDDEGGDAGALNRDLEPGEILDGEADKDDDPPARVDDSRLHMFCDDEGLGWDSPDDTSDSLSSRFPCPQLPWAPSSASSTHFQPSNLHHYQHPFITHLDTTQQSISPLGPNEISLNSPERADRPKYPLPSTNTTSSKARAASVQMDTSEDSDTAASRMMKSLTMHLRKASLGVRTSHTSGGHVSSDQDSDQSPTTSHNRSVSRKRPRDPTAELTMKLNEASDTLVQHIHETSTVKADHKRLKLETQLASRELKMRESHTEREHGLRSTIAIQNHERAMADERTKQLELEIKLEQVRLERLIMEKDLARQDSSAENHN